jgi:trk system potassium uptake protein TrkA
MFVMIAGGGRTGSQLALLLLAQDHEVRLIENRRDVLSRIHRELPTEVIYEGNPIDPLVLESAGIKDAQVLAAVTTSDEQNLALCFFARTKFNIRRTIARVNNPANAWLFDQKFHVDVAMNQSEIMASMIEEEMSMGDMMTLLKLRRGNYSLVEEKIPPGARAIGIPIRELGLPDHCVIAAIIRKGEVIVPRGVIAFEADDEVLAVTNADGAEKLANMFMPPAVRTFIANK